MVSNGLVGTRKRREVFPKNTDKHSISMYMFKRGHINTTGRKTNRTAIKKIIIFITIVSESKPLNRDKFSPTPSSRIPIVNAFT